MSPQPLFLDTVPFPTEAWLPPAASLKQFESPQDALAWLRTRLPNARAIQAKTLDMANTAELLEYEAEKAYSPHGFLDAIVLVSGCPTLVYWEYAANPEQPVCEVVPEPH